MIAKADPAAEIFAHEWWVKHALRVCLRSRDVDDLAQEILLKAWQSRHTYNPAFFDGSDGTPCSHPMIAWLSGIVRHAVTDHWRSRSSLKRGGKRRHVSTVERHDGPEELVSILADRREPLPVANLIADESRQQAHELVNSLSGHVRELVKLRY
ncbi:MAG: hypothetical protein KF708_15755, partial [Pirellulales bacterium]|nr:hypothetical protein [Pirellulales bacterium]